MAAAPRGGRRAAWDVMPAGLSPPPDSAITPNRGRQLDERLTRSSPWCGAKFDFFEADFLAPGRRAKDSSNIVKFMVPGSPDHTRASSLGSPRQPCSIYPFWLGTASSRRAVTIPLPRGCVADRSHAARSPQTDRVRRASSPRGSHLWRAARPRHPWRGQRLDVRSHRERGERD